MKSQFENVVIAQRDGRSISFKVHNDDEKKVAFARVGMYVNVYCDSIPDEWKRDGEMALIRRVQSMLDGDASYVIMLRDSLAVNIDHNDNFVVDHPDYGFTIAHSSQQLPERLVQKRPDHLQGVRTHA